MRRTLTVVNTGRGLITVHRPGCADLIRRPGASSWTVEAASLREIVVDTYPADEFEDMEPDGSNWVDFAGDFQVMPCAGPLPDEAPADPRRLSRATGGPPSVHTGAGGPSPQPSVTPARGEPAMTRRRLRLPDPYGPLTTIEDADPRTGVVVCRIRGRRVAGAVTIRPTHDGTLSDGHAISPRVLLQWGTGPRYLSDREREDALVIHGVPLVGGVELDPGEYLTRTGRGAWLRFHRPTGRYTSQALPDATNAYAVAIARALLAAWYARPDRDQLRRAAAIGQAPARLRQLEQYRIDPARDRLAAAAAELAELEQWAAQLRALVAEHTATRGDAP